MSSSSSNREQAQEGILCGGRCNDLAARVNKLVTILRDVAKNRDTKYLHGKRKREIRREELDNDLRRMKEEANELDEQRFAAIDEYEMYNSMRIESKEDNPQVVPFNNVERAKKMLGTFLNKSNNSQRDSFRDLCKEEMPLRQKLRELVRLNNTKKQKTSVATPAEDNVTLPGSFQQTITAQKRTDEVQAPKDTQTSQMAAKIPDQANRQQASTSGGNFQQSIMAQKRIEEAQVPKEAQKSQMAAEKTDQPNRSTSARSLQQSIMAQKKIGEAQALKEAQKSQMAAEKLDQPNRKQESTSAGSLQQSILAQKKTDEAQAPKEAQKSQMAADKTDQPNRRKESTSIESLQQSIMAQKRIEEAQAPKETQKSQIATEKADVLTPKAKPLSNPHEKPDDDGDVIMIDDATPAQRDIQLADVSRQQDMLEQPGKGALKEALKELSKKALDPKTQKSNDFRENVEKYVDKYYRSAEITAKSKRAATDEDSPANDSRQVSPILEQPGKGALKELSKKALDPKTQKSNDFRENVEKHVDKYYRSAEITAKSKRAASDEDSPANDSRQVSPMLENISKETASVSTGPQVVPKEPEQSPFQDIAAPILIPISASWIEVVLHEIREMHASVEDIKVVLYVEQTTKSVEATTCKISFELSKLPQLSQQTKELISLRQKQRLAPKELATLKHYLSCNKVAVTECTF